MSVWALGLFAGCRDYQEPIASEVCQPYPLACADCRFDDDVADTDGQLRVYRCETPDGAGYDAVDREGGEGAARDTHFYDPDSGERVAAVRSYADPIDVCGEEADEEWYGVILDDCAPVCEHEPASPDADPDLPIC